jgi:hypothetical protein
VAPFHLLIFEATAKIPLATAVDIFYSPFKIGKAAEIIMHDGPTSTEADSACKGGKTAGRTIRAG